MQNEPAFPEWPMSNGAKGLTKLEYFAGLAQAAMIQRGYDNTREVIAEEAVKDAKALIAALDAALTTEKPRAKR